MAPEDPVHIEVWCPPLHLQPQPSHQAVLSLSTASTPEPWGQPPGPLHLAGFPTRASSALPSRHLHTGGTTHCQPVPSAQLADVHLSWSGGVQPLLRFRCVCLTLCTKLILDRLCHGGLTCCEICKLISLLGHFCSFYFSSSSSLSKFQLISHQNLPPFFLIFSPLSYMNPITLCIPEALNLKTSMMYLHQREERLQVSK